MVKVLFIHIGNPVPDNFKQDGVPIVEMPTLTEGVRKFREKDLINNIRTRDSISQLEGVELNFVCFTDRKSLVGLLKSGIELRRILNQGRYDICHAFWGSSSGLIVSLFSPVPSIIALAGSDLLGNYTHDGKSTFGGKISGFLSQLMGLFATQIFTMSEHMKGELNFIARKKTCVLPEGVDTQRFKPVSQAEARKSLGYPLDKKIVIYFPSDFTWVKDPKLAKDVFNLVKEEIDDAELIYVNSIPPSKVHLVYNAADVMLLTSRHEGSNNSIKEAMSCNLPVVSVNVGDAVERLSPLANSYVAKTREPRELVNEIVKILKTGERSNGRNFVEQISLENCAKYTFEVYKKLLKQ